MNISFKYILNEIMQIPLALYCKFFGTKVGVDEYSNTYYELKSTNYWGVKRRICIYKGIPEATKIPPEWHGWMHYNLQLTDIEKLKNRYKWQIYHRPLLTLTRHRYHPNNPHNRQQKARQYLAWQPN